MLLSLPGFSCGVADAKFKKFWVFFKKIFDECALASTRASTKHKWFASADS